ncbi:MAG: chloride channel protein [Acidobacteria bacterium]|nr:chloride channel protein [Acidobacteriota bacterium]MBV9147999.1 chloride channel protein [Acidobacteriota bacterium]MBV9436119.1 chloride channel protein [Acidobacteriota bacterium]
MSDVTPALADHVEEQPSGKVASQGERFFLVLAIFIGVLAGLSVVCFRIAIEFVRITLLGSSLSPGFPRIVLAPAFTGIVVALLVLFAFPRARGSGVNQTKAALYIYDGYIPFRTAVGKFVCSALAIGSGQSLGPEDPSLQIGASIASALGRRLQLNRERLRLIAPIGAAAGLSAAFNSPISAVLFVIEEVIGRWTASIFGAVVLAAVSSVVVARYFLGSQPLFRIPPVQFIAPSELFAYGVLGIVGAIAAVIFAKAIEILRPRMKSLPRWTQFLQPALAGLIIGLIGWLGRPEVMGAGYEFMDQAMHDQFAWKVMAILAGLKILSTTLSFVSGTPGGMFAPTLFIGAMLGGAVGGVERLLFPHLTGSVGTYALVGMGVLFAAFLRVPLTSVFMVLEVSGNYSIIVPVILANTLAYLISRNLQPVPIFDMLSRQDGIDLPSMEEQREERVLRVEDAMRAVDVPIVNSHETIEDALHALEATSSPDVLVDDPPFGWCSLSRETLTGIVVQGKGVEVLSEILPEARMPVLYPDNRLEVALRHIAQWPFLPVVHRANPKQLVGLISLRDVMSAFVQ